jgi:hypothetical protein
MGNVTPSGMGRLGITGIGATTEAGTKASTGVGIAIMANPIRRHIEPIRITEAIGK